MSPDVKLKLFCEKDGDIILSIIPSAQKKYSNGYGYEAFQVQFCTVGSGGGRSPHTREALFKLMEAIEKDNEERPI
jgi:DNA invertase Pin-like site-specific DNA recombinase